VHSTTGAVLHAYLNYLVSNIRHISLAFKISAHNIFALDTYILLVHSRASRNVRRCSCSVCAAV